MSENNIIQRVFHRENDNNNSSSNNNTCSTGMLFITKQNNVKQVIHNTYKEIREALK